MIPLSKAVMRMSTYDRTNQELNWYEQSFYLCTTNCHMARKIEAECRRRKIDCEDILCVVEMSKDKRKELSEGVINHRQKYDKYPDERLAYHVLKIRVRTWKTTALERKQLADWAITTFNFKEMLLPADDIMAYGVWIQPSKEVSVDHDSYNMDGTPGSTAYHWVHDMDGMPGPITLPWF